MISLSQKGFCLRARFNSLKNVWPPWKMAGESKCAWEKIVKVEANEIHMWLITAEGTGSYPAGIIN